MSLPIPPFEKINSLPTILELPKDNFLEDFVEIHHQEPSLPDIELPTEDAFYLIRQRVENIREKVDVTLDEIVELRELEAIIREYEEELEAIPNNLGMPSKIDQLTAGLEAKRVNRVDDAKYDGGEVDETNESFSNLDSEHIKWFQESWLNTKTLRVLSNQKKPIYSKNAKQQKLNIFDIFPKTSLYEVFSRCKSLTTSPIYGERKELGEEYYQLQHGIQVKFKDQSALFLIPFKEFSDIPKHSLALPESPAYLIFSIVLPKDAHHKRRFFKKNATVKGFMEFYKKLAEELPENWLTFLKKLQENGLLRMYHETLELKNEKRVRAYFFNITGGYQNGQYFPKHYIEKCVRDKLSQAENIGTRSVHKECTWFPEWMRKIGGFIIETKQGNSVSFPKPQKISVDTQFNSQVYQEWLFIPSKKLMESQVSPQEWQEAVRNELRERYKKNAGRFREYADLLKARRVEFVCGCGEGHQEKCVVPILQEIFFKILHI